MSPRAVSPRAVSPSFRQGTISLREGAITLTEEVVPTSASPRSEDVRDSSKITFQTFRPANKSPQKDIALTHQQKSPESVDAQQKLAKSLAEEAIAQTHAGLSHQISTFQTRKAANANASESVVDETTTAAAVQQQKLAKSLAEEAIAAALNKTQRPPLSSQGAVSLAPRIDISRASSSSREHDSKDSGTEAEFDENIDDYTQSGPKTKARSASVSAVSSLGFKEEGALDLRSSTEELDFLGPGAKPVEEPRRESQCSEVVLLCISGRTSRVSSLSSAGGPRTPSPHSLLLETSFCGTGTPTGVAVADVETGGTPLRRPANVAGSAVSEAEKVLLARGTDPTEAVFAEGFR